MSWLKESEKATADERSRQSQGNEQAKSEAEEKKATLLERWVAFDEPVQELVQTWNKLEVDRIVQDLHDFLGPYHSNVSQLKAGFVPNSDRSYIEPRRRVVTVYPDREISVAESLYNHFSRGYRERGYGRGRIAKPIHDPSVVSFVSLRKKATYEIEKGGGDESYTITHTRFSVEMNRDELELSVGDSKTTFALDELQTASDLEERVDSFVAQLVRETGSNP